MKFLAASFISTLALQVFADTSNDVLFDKNSPSESQPEQMITPSARGSTKNISYIVGADYLYWGFSQDGMDFAFSNYFDPENQNGNVSHQTQRINIMWGQGFKIFMGVNLPYDGWDLIGSWTRIQQSKSKNVSGTYAPLNYITQYGNYSDTSYVEWNFLTSATQTWSVSFSMADLLLSRVYKISERLVLRPRAGLTYLHIEQHLNQKYFNITSAPVLRVQDKISSHTNGIGPKFAFMSRYLATENLGFVNELGLSALYTRQNSRLNNQGSSIYTNTGASSTFTNRTKVARAVLQLETGFDYGKQFDNGCYARIEAKYSFNYLWSQLTLSSPLANYKSDLMVQGATVGLALEF